MKIKTFLALLVTSLLWPSSLVGIRIGLEGFDAGPLALFRYLIASTCMLFFFFIWGRPHHKPDLRELGLIFLSGAIGFSLYNIALNQGEMTVDPGTASFVLAQIPVAIVILAMIFLQERLNFYGWLGIVISIIGVGLVALGKDATEHSGRGIINSGFFYILVAILCHAVYSIISKPLLRKFNAIEFTTYTMCGGTVALLFYAPSLASEITHASTAAILAAIYIGVFPAAIGYITWSYALNHLPASKVGSTIYTQPAVAILLSWLILSEIPTLLSFIGGAVSLVGAIVVNLSFRVKAAQIPLPAVGDKS